MGIAIGGKKITGAAIGGKVASGIAVSGASVLSVDGGTYLDYIQSTGTQYIDTKFLVPETNDFQIEVEYQAVKTSDPKAVYGTNTFDYATNNFSFTREYEKLIVANRESGYTAPLNNIELNPLSLSTWYTVIHRRDFVSINDVRYDYPKPEQQAAPTKPVFIFARNDNGTPALLESGRLKRFTVRMDDGSILLNLRAYRTEDGIICMKDTVSKELFLNSGTGVFQSNEKNVDVTSSIGAMAADLGDVIRTNGFYSANDGGGATYDVVEPIANDGITTFATSNYKTAKLRENNSMNVLQFGARPVTSVSSFQNLQKAFDSSAGIIEFPSSKEFLIDRQLWFKSDKTYRGNKSTIVTDNTMVLEHFISEGRIAYIMNANNVTIDGLNMKATHTTYDPDTSVKIQLAVHSAENVLIKNCKFEGPPPQYNPDGSAIIDYFHNVDVYTGAKNCIVEDNEMVLTHDGFEGTCVMVRDLWKLGTSNVHVRRNNMDKVCHDEILSVGMPNAVLSDIHIYENTMKMRDGQDSSSVYAVTLMDSASVSVENLSFTDNVLDVQTTYAAVKINTLTAKRFLFERNTISHSRGKGYPDESSSIDVDGYIILRLGDISPVLTLKENILNVDNSGVKKVKTIVSAPNTIAESNKITISGNVSESVLSVTESTNNIITSTGDVVEVFRNVEKTFNNTITAGVISDLYRYFNKEFTDLFEMKQNTVNATEIQRLLSSTGGGVGVDSTVTVQNDNYTVTSENAAYLYAFWTALAIHLNFLTNKVNNNSLTTLFTKKTGVSEQDVTIVN